MSDIELLDVIQELITTMDNANKEVNKWIDTANITDERLLNTIYNTNEDGKRFINETLNTFAQETDDDIQDMSLFTSGDATTINMMHKYGSQRIVLITGTPIVDTTEDILELLKKE